MKLIHVIGLINKAITVLFGVTGDGSRFNSITAGSKSQYLHTVISVLAQSVQDGLAGRDDFGIFARFV